MSGNGSRSGGAILIVENTELLPGKNDIELEVLNARDLLWLGRDGWQNGIHA
jgi:hypothetical protein